MRFGKNYHCGADQNIEIPQNCTSGGTLLSFISITPNEGFFPPTIETQITYRFSGQAIEKREGIGAYIAVTPPGVVIEDLVFYTFGTDSSDGLQPKVIIKITGHVGEGADRSDFTLQTMVSQRSLDKP